MPRDATIPDAFDVYTVVVLRRPADAPDLMDDELDALQARHLAYRAELRDQGKRPTTRSATAARCPTPNPN